MVMATLLRSLPPLSADGHNLGKPPMLSPALRLCRSKRRPGAPIRALSDLPTVLEDPRVTWQAAIGAIAGVTPFVVAGIEFSKRIMAQKKCKICRGSGLVKKDNYYFRCYSCGGFLPWQSWRRFFSGR